MSRTKYLQFPGFFGLASAVLLVATASLAQAANNVMYWNVTGSANWSNLNNWTAGVFGLPNSNGGSVINNGGTVNVGAGDNIPDTSGYGYVFIGGSSANLGGSGGNGYVNMTGGTLGSNGLSAGVRAGSAGRGGGQWNLHPIRRSEYALLGHFPW